jgi:phospholipid/cholesterol/gamma-HCH transport system ATP-binding protein
MVVTHDIATAKNIADYIGMLYRRNLVQFGPAKEMFESDIPVVRQFLAGATDGPIGMSEEKDSSKDARDEATRPRSSSGKTAAETEEMERAAGASDNRDLRRVPPPPPPPAEDHGDGRTAEETRGGRHGGLGGMFGRGKKG